MLKVKDCPSKVKGFCKVTGKKCCFLNALPLTSCSNVPTKKKSSRRRSRLKK